MLKWSGNNTLRLACNSFPLWLTRQLQGYRTTHRTEHGVCLDNRRHGSSTCSLKRDIFQGDVPYAYDITRNKETGQQQEFVVDRCAVAAGKVLYIVSADLA